VIIGPKHNIPFHEAVMENPRFVKGALGTHFIEKEITLLTEVKTIMERDKPLEKKLPPPSEDRKRIAAIAAAAVVMPRYRQCRS